MKIKRDLEVKIPMVPNFIEVGGEYQNLAAFSDEELEAIGAAWTLKLKQRAKEQRASDPDFVKMMRELG